MKIRLLEAELFHAGNGRTNMTKETVAFCNFEGAHNKQRQSCARCLIDISRLNRTNPTYSRCCLSSNRYMVSPRSQIDSRIASQWTRHDEQRSYLSRKNTVSQLHRPQHWPFSEKILRSYESCERQTHKDKMQKCLSLLEKQLRKLSMNCV